MADKGRRNKIYTTIGANNHVAHDRQAEDFYATHPKATELLLEVETFSGNVWEPACGQGHIASVLVENDINVFATDLVYRGYGEESEVDFLDYNGEWEGDIITNPPYKLAKEFIEKSLQIINHGNKVAMFLKLTFMEGKGRKELFLNNPPKTIYVSSSRIPCAMNGNFDVVTSSAVAYGWYVWEKGFEGNTTVKWIN